MSETSELVVDRKLIFFVGFVVVVLGARAKASEHSCTFKCNAYFLATTQVTIGYLSSFSVAIKCRALNLVSGIFMERNMSLMKQSKLTMRFPQPSH